MSKRIKDIAIGFIIGCALMMTTPVLADSIIQTIDVVLNGVNVEVEGIKLDANSILYNGSTYLPMRVVVEAVGKDVEWDQTTMTANIVGKPLAITETIPNVGVNGNMPEEFNVIEKVENDIPAVAEKDGEIYYTINEVLDLLKVYGEYTFNNRNGNISIVLMDGTTVVDNVEYTLDKGIMYISKTFYENSILPLIK